MTQTPAALASVAAEPPCLATDVVACAVESQFDLRGVYRSLISERDQNFRLTTANGDRYVVKVTGSTERPIVTDFQVDALLHLEAKGLPGVPRIIRTLSGQRYGRIASAGDADYCLRVVTYVDGEPLDDAKITPTMARGFGKRMAQLDEALQDFSHAGEDQVLLWDTERAGELLSLCTMIKESAVRDLVETILRRFKEHVLPAIKCLPHQVIHNDANPENVLIDSNANLCGIIDFGDMLKAPRIVEVSTACSYLRASDTDSVDLIAAFVRGYRSSCRLQSVEFDVLFDLIRTRLAMTLTILHWRLAARGAHDLYRQKSLAGVPGSTQLLSDLNTLGSSLFRERVTDES